MYGKEEKNAIIEEKTKGKLRRIIILTIGVLLFAGVLVGSIVLGGNGNKLQKQLDLGTKYLDDMDYEQALVAFEVALDIDPMNVDAYLGIVEVYIRTNEFEKALEVAKEGYETTGDERLKEKIEIIESGDIVGSLVEAIATENNDNKLQEQLKLGTRYLEDMDYDQALVAFGTALDIDPMNADAYLGIVEVYIRINEFEKALEVAKEGYEVTGDERLKEKMDMIESGNIFAANGWVMRSSCYDNDGNLLYYHQYTYNQKGQKASIARCDASGSETQYLELDYDGEDRPVVSYIIMDDGSLLKVVFEYSDNGYRETEYSSTDGDVCGYFEAETDADGKVLKKSFYDKNGNLKNSSEYKYDEHGNEIRVNVYDAEGNMDIYWINTYDEEDKLLQTQLYTPDGEMYEYIESIYDEGGNYIGFRDYDGDGKLYTETINQ
jgi:thioredoxin-like negative regulator of GroEL